MNYKLRYLPLACEDIEELVTYLLRFYPGTAGFFLGELEQRIADLRNHPKMCEEYAEDTYYRRMVVSDYLVFYHVNERREAVEIHRVLRGSWDVNRYLKRGRN
jgi:plasmid stabilization system protein ParE